MKVSNMSNYCKFLICGLFRIFICFIFIWIVFNLNELHPWYIYFFYLKNLFDFIVGSSPLFKISSKSIYSKQNIHYNILENQIRERAPGSIKKGRKHNLMYFQGILVYRKNFSLLDLLPCLIGLDFIYLCFLVQFFFRFILLFDIHFLSFLTFLFL